MASEYDVVGAFQDIEMELIKSIQRTMKRHIGEEFQEDINWSQWQAEMLNGLAQYKYENADKLQGYYSTINDEIEQTIRQAYQLGESEQEIEILKAIQEGFKIDKTGIGTNAMQGSFFKVNKEKLNSLIKATTKDMSKAENAILRMTDDVYRQTIFKAQMFYNSGASTLWKAVDMATKDFLSAGINCVEYKNGARVNIASYSEMALRTANKRANLMGSANKREEWGIHTVKVSSHNSACPMCIQWQGKVYIDDVYGVGTKEESRKSGYPLLSEAVKGGMFHPNCKNGCSTYYEGINQPPKEPTKEEVEEMTRRYNLEQRQRECERNIRKYKRLENGSIDADNIAKYEEKLRQWTNEYNRLIANNEDVLRADPARLKLYGINTNDFKPAIKATTKKAIISHSDAYNTLIDRINVINEKTGGGIEYNEVKYLKNKLSENAIIEKLGGGDLTNGSCASLAFAYTGNKNGLDVTDYRGGQSREFFSTNGYIKKIMELDGVKCQTVKVKKEAFDTAKIIKELPVDKEYYLAVGKHAAIIKNTEKGVMYLELQSSRENGWKYFASDGRTTSETLMKRFGARKTVDRQFGKVWEKEVVLAEVDSFKDNEEFRDILGYINTAKDKQKKGEGGYAK